MSAPLTLSEALEQYLDARDVIAEVAEERDDWSNRRRTEAVAAMTEAAARMDELAPNPERQ